MLSLSLLFTLFILYVCNAYIFHGTFHKVDSNPFPFASNSFITLPLCIGDNDYHQCFDLLFDIEARYILLINSKLDPLNGYDINKSKGYSREPNTGYITTIPPMVSVASHIAYDDLWLGGKVNKIPFLEAHAINGNGKGGKTEGCPYQGFLGFSLRNEIGNDFLIMNYLKKQELSLSNSFYQKFISKDKVDIFVGEPSVDYNMIALTEMEFCFLEEQTRYATDWKCAFEYIGNNKGKNIIKKLDETNSKVSFHSTWTGIVIPSTIVDDIFNFYITKSNGHCHYVIDTEPGFRHLGDYIQCDTDYDLDSIPDLELGYYIKKLVIKLKAKDMFDSRKMSKFRKEENRDTWHLDMDVIKHYNIYYNDENNRMGFKENHIFDKKDELYQSQKINYKELYIVIIFLTLSGSCMLLFSQKKHIVM